MRAAGSSMQSYPAPSSLAQSSRIGDANEEDDEDEDEEDDDDDDDGVNESGGGYFSGGATANAGESNGAKRPRFAPEAVSAV